MKHKTLVLGLMAIGILGAGGHGLYHVGMSQGMSEGMSMAVPAASANPPVLNAMASLPQSIAEGEDATRRHITAGIKAGDVDPANGGKEIGRAHV